MKTFTLKWLVIGTLLAGATWQALADDLYPPPWTRYSPYTTYMDTHFQTTGNNPQPPEQYFNPNGVPSIYTSGTWSQIYDNRPGSWYLGGGGYMQCDVPNWVDNQPSKQIYLQLTWEQEGTTPLHVTVDGLPGTLVNEIPLGGPGTWEYSRWYFQLIPNPAHELLQITGDVHIDQLVFDTISIPEPGTGLLVILGAGLMQVVRRRPER